MIYIYPQAEPFFLRGKNDSALLFIHGFTASPSEVYPTALLLHQMTDISVCGLLLPGHGASPRYLQETTWEDWYDSVCKELNHLLDHYKQVFIAGLSMGALLALQAAKTIKGIRGVISINAPLYSNHPLLTVSAPVMRMVKPYYPKKDRVRLRDLAAQGRFAYEVTPVKAFQSMLRLRQQLINDLDNMKVPLLIIQSMKDESVNPKSADYLLENTGAEQVRKVELANSEHIATMGSEKEKIAEEIIGFIEEINN